MENRAYSKTFRIVLVGLFAALMAVCSWISIPLPGLSVPITLGTLGATLCGGLLGAGLGSLSVLIFLLLGAVGLPVFHGFTGGAGILAGPTGGYLIGYLTLAFFTGILIRVFCRSKLTWYGIVLATLIGEVTCYVLGTAWFCVLTKTAPLAALAMCVFPFLPGDALKIVCSTILIRRVRPLVGNQISAPARA